MSRVTMSRTGFAAAAALFTSVTLLGSPAQSAETPSSVGLTPDEIQSCIQRVGSRNPDVLQGWIDGCRTTKAAAYFGNESLQSYV